MGLGYKSKQGTEGIPVFQGTGKDIQLAQGGFLLEKGGLPDGTLIKAGTPMRFDESTRKATFVATGKIVEAAAADATNYKIAKGHTLKVGDNFAAKPSDKAYPITAINTSNPDYDVVTVGTTIGALPVDSMVFGSTTTGEDNSSFGGVKGLLYSDRVVGDGESCSVAVRATVYARRIPYSVELEEALPRIIFSQSY